MAKDIFVRSKSFKNALKKAGEIVGNRESLTNLLSKTRKKAAKVENSEGILQKALGKIYTFVRMIRAYLTGEYKDIPLKSIILITAGLIYFVVPVDVIPDFIPGLGMIDDATIILAVFKSIAEDVEKFEEFENENK